MFADFGGELPMATQIVVGASEIVKSKIIYIIVALILFVIAFKKFGQKIIGNIVIIGYLSALLGVVSSESLKKSITRHVPKKAIEANHNAFDEGYNLV